MSKLYIVGTPIGNLSDFSVRGKETLEKVDFIAAEDTRVTLKILNHLGVKKSLCSYYDKQKNQKGREEEICQRILQGESCALVTDAGMPAISDPGEKLVKACIEKGIEIEVVPGPTALITALAMSGLSTEKFTFEGFLPSKTGDRKKELKKLIEEKRTMVFYESPYRVKESLEDIKEIFGGDRKIAVGRELTKMYEEMIRGSIDEAINHFSKKEPKGEFVFVIEGNIKEKEYTLEEAVKIAKDYIKKGNPPSFSAKEAAKISGIPKGTIYNILLENNQK